MVCRGQTCGLPVSDVEGLQAQLTLGFDRV
jgi:hypothetical protein